MVANFESNGRSNVENSGTCPTYVLLDRYLHSTLGGTMQLMSPNANFGGRVPLPCPPRDLRSCRVALFLEVDCLFHQTVLG